jgi:hypothetical protein
VIFFQPKTAAWSKQKEKKQKKKEQKDLKSRKRRRENVNDDDNGCDDDLDDLAKDIRLMKKLKTGKVFLLLLYCAFLLHYAFTSRVFV